IDTSIPPQSTLGCRGDSAGGRGAAMKCIRRPPCFKYIFTTIRPNLHSLLRSKWYLARQATLRDANYYYADLLACLVQTHGRDRIRLRVAERNPRERRPGAARNPACARKSAWRKSTRPPANPTGPRY